MTTPEHAQRRARWWNSLYWRVGLGFVVFVVALLLVQSAIFIYWVDRPGQGRPRQGQLRRVLTAAAELGRAFERGGPVDVEAVLRRAAPIAAAPLYVVLADGTAVARRRRAGARRGPADRAADAARRARRGPDQPLTSAGRRPTRRSRRGGALEGIRDRRAAADQRPAARVHARAVAAELPAAARPHRASPRWSWSGRRGGASPASRRRRCASPAATSARAPPDDGRDEVSMVARAFNRMSTELAARDAALQAADRRRAGSCSPTCRTS